MQDEEIAEVVREHGWCALNVSDHSPPFLYSVGLMQSSDLPELIIFGLESRESHTILSAITRTIRAGGSFGERGVYDGLLADNLQIGIRHVHPTQHRLYLGYAMGYCRYIGRIGELQAVQVFWPDKTGKFPFDVGCDLDVYKSQPRLDIPLTPAEIKEIEGQFGWNS